MWCYCESIKRCNTKYVEWSFTHGKSMKAVLLILGTECGGSDSFPDWVNPKFMPHPSDIVVGHGGKVVLAEPLNWAETY